MIRSTLQFLARLLLTPFLAALTLALLIASPVILAVMSVVSLAAYGGYGFLHDVRFFYTDFLLSPLRDLWGKP